MEVMKLAVDVELFIIIKSVSMKPKSYQLSFNQLFVIILIVQILSIIVVLMRMWINFINVIILITIAMDCYLKILNSLKDYYYFHSIYLFEVELGESS